MAEIVVSTEAEVVDAVRVAREDRRTLEIVGGGTRRNFGRPTQCDDVLDLSALSGIVNYEPEELIITVKPGTPLDEINAALAAKNQRLGFEPQDWRMLLGSHGTPTIGGAISANANGSAAIRFGRARDHLLGFHAVNGFGEAYKGGGKVVKNVTGFDLPKLMCGAMGTLGPITELTLRVFPKVETAVLAIGGVELEEGLKLLRKVGSSSLEATGLMLLSNDIWREVAKIDSTEPERFVVDEDDDEEYGPINDCAAVFRLEGTPTALVEERAMLKALLEGFNPTEVEDGDGIFRGATYMFTKLVLDVWLMHVPPVVCTSIVGKLQRRFIADWAGARIWREDTPGYDGAWMREETEACGGSATLLRASDETRKRTASFSPEPLQRAALTRAVKAAFDPLRIFNPGRMYESI